MLAAEKLWRIAEASVFLIRELESERKQNQEYLSLLEVSRTVSSTLEIHPLLEKIMKVATRFLNCQTATVYLLDKETNELFFYLVLGDEKIGSKLKEIRLPLGTGLAGTCALENKPLIVREASQDSRFFSQADRISGFSTRSVLCVPLRLQEKVIGVIQVINRLDELSFNDHDQELLDVIAAQAAVCIENAQLYEKLQAEISQRKTMEKALEQNSAELVKARDQALELARVKSEFLANMSHEIRTPMNAVVGMLSLLMKTPLSDEQREMVRTIRVSSDTLLQEISDILDYSKIEAGKIDLEVIDFDPRTTIEETLDLVSSLASEKKLELALLVRPGLPLRVAGDPGRLRKVLLNLLSNAIKFTSKGDVVVKVWPQPLGSHCTRVHFEVSDTGIGISPEKLAGLFQPFSQGDTSITRRFGGTGLGLSISRRLVELMGGVIGVRSELGKGTTFWFSVDLPCVPAVEIPQKVSVDLSGKTMLALVGNPLIETILSSFLDEKGIRLETVQNEDQLFQVLRSQNGKERRIDAILIDFLSPKDEIYRIAREIRKRADSPVLPLVLLASFSERGDADQLKTAGFTAFITKPMRQRAFNELLFEIFQEDRQDRHSESLITRHSVAEKLGSEKIHLLVAEDNPTNQKLILLLLEDLGYRSDIVENGEEAVRAFGARKYDGILMDSQMPVMDGLEATRRIRQMGENGTRVPIIALTARVLDGEKEKCLESGMSDFLPKPIDVDQLERTLRKWFPPSAKKDSLSIPREPPAHTAVDPVLPLCPDLDHVIQRMAALGKHIKWEGLSELWTSYISDIPKFLESVKKFLVEKDFSGIRKAVHTVKGMSYNVGAKNLGDICDEIGKLDDLNPESFLVARKLVDSFEEKFQKLVDGYFCHLESRKQP